MATKKNTKSQSKKTVYSVLRGSFDDSPEQVAVIGLFTSLQDAQKRVLKEYRSAACDGLDPRPSVTPKAFRVLDNGYEFWTIATHRV